MKKRYLDNFVKKDLKDKMVLLGGPRQVGKTTFSKFVGDNYYKNYTYLNWDKREMRSDIRNSKWPSDTKFIILDEIHKYTKWKSFIKGEYDIHKDKYDFMLTGSARLNVYKKGGDSLFGRYHYYSLHPFSYAELLGINSKHTPGKELFFPKHKKNLNIINDLLTYGGFPEPYLKKDKIFLQRWHNERKDLLFKEDIRDLTSIKDISSMDILSDILPHKVGSTLSINSIKEDLEVNHRTVKNWLKTFEMLYYSFRLYPYQSKKIKALKKEAKLYLWDWSEIETKGEKLENLVASHLLKFCNYMYDVFGYKIELFYIRDKYQKEVDFLVTYNLKPWFAVEVKNTKKELSKYLKYFTQKLSIPFSYQIINNFDEDYMKDRIRVMPLDKFLSALV